MRNWRAAASPAAACCTEGRKENAERLSRCRSYALAGQQRPLVAVATSVRSLTMVERGSLLRGTFTNRSDDAAAGAFKRAAARLDCEREWRLGVAVVFDMGPHCRREKEKRRRCRRDLRLRQYCTCTRSCAQRSVSGVNDMWRASPGVER